ncbi:glucooligosaccharide oxidase [Lyophyllum atratum]|nr:glucooligosaccharide oxidase [Lyophyllum atratum]
MYRLTSVLLLALTTSLVASFPTAAADLRGSLTSLGINASFPGDASYATASAAFNLRFTIKPAAIAFPKNPQEVSEAIQVGAAEDLTVVARSGGHSYIANGLGGQDGALVVDLKNLNKVTVDSTKGTAVIESGNRLGDVAAALGNAGRALPHGTCPYVGIGGHASYGGFGFSARMWGLTLDNIIAVNTVLANGTIIRVTAQNNPDLFWGLRGSAGSLGITTSIEVTTFPAPPSATIFQYDWNLNATAAAKGISAFQSFVQTNIPFHLGAEINLGTGSSAGTVYFSLAGAWYAPVSGLNATLAPLLRQMPSNPRTTIRTGTYLNSVKILAEDSLDEHDTFYAKSLMTPDSSPMSDAAILAFTKYLTTQGSSAKTPWFVQIELYGGKNSAVNAVAPDATAFAHRNSTFTIQFYASSPGYKPPYPASGFTFMDDMVKTLTSNSPQNWDYGAYPNYMDDKLADWQQRYYGAHYARLQTLKDQYDPHGVFDFPTGIADQ